MNNSQQKNYVLPIVMMIALFAMISFVTGLPNPMGVIVKNQFGASNFMSQLGNAANFIAYAFMGLPAGLLLQRIGYKKTALLAIIVGFTGVGIQYISGSVATSNNFAIYLIGAFVSGFSMCMLNTVVNPMLNTLGGGGKKGNQLIQIGGTFNSLSATIVPVLVGYFIGNAVRPSIKDANPALFIAMGIFALVFFVLLLVDIPEPHKTTEKKEKSKYSPLSFRHFILGTVAIFVYVGVEVGIPNISNLFMTTKTTEQFAEYEQEYLKQKNDPAYLQQLIAEADRAVAEADVAREQKAADLDEKIAKAKVADAKVIKEEDYIKAKEVKVPGLGMDPAIAGSVVGTYWFLMLIGRFLGASLGAKFSSKTMLSFTSLLGIALVMMAIFIPVGSYISMPVFKSSISFGLESVPINVFFLILCGLCTSIMWGGIFNLAVEGLGKYTAAASGLFMVMVCGGGILPLIQGAVVDVTDYLTSYWVVAVALGYLLFYALIGCKNVNKDIPVE